MAALGTRLYLAQCSTLRTRTIVPPVGANENASGFVQLYGTYHRWVHHTTVPVVSSTNAPDQTSSVPAERE